MQRRGVSRLYLHRTRTLHEPERFPIKFNGNRSPKVGSCNMDSSDYTQLPVATIPALVSTGITILYFVLKLINYLTDAKPGAPNRKETERRTDQEGQPKQGPDQGGRCQSQIREQTQRPSGQERYGKRWNPSPTGPIFLRGPGQDISLHAQRDAPEHNDMPSLCANDERLSGRRSASASPLTCQGSASSFHVSARICEQGAGKQNTINEQSPCHGRTGIQDEPTTTQPTTRDNAARIQRFSEAPASPNSGPTKTKTVDIGAQTDDTEHFYVSKDTILAYTIAVVQNTQAYHFGQMSVVFQMAQNKAALETPSRAEEFTNEHFNIKLLTDKENYKGPLNAQAHKRKASVDATPTKPTQETVPKVVEPSNSASNQKSQPTGTVLPTCRPKKGTCNGIPAGCESDDSWGGYSHNDDPQQQTPNLDEELYPLVAYRMWTRPHTTGRGRPRGVPRGSHHRAPNRQIPVRDGYERPQRPWDGQPYGRRTRSQ